MNYYHLTADIEPELQELEQTSNSCKNDNDDDPNWLIIPSLSKQEEPPPPPAAATSLVKLRPKSAGKNNRGQRLSNRLSQWLWTPEPPCKEDDDPVAQRITEIFQSLQTEAEPINNARYRHRVSGYFNDWAKWLSKSSQSGGG